jgi:hypothetical protein
LVSPESVIKAEVTLLRKVKQSDFGALGPAVACNFNSPVRAERIDYDHILEAGYGFEALRDVLLFVEG